MQLVAPLRSLRPSHTCALIQSRAEGSHVATISTSQAALPLAAPASGPRRLPATRKWRQPRVRSMAVHCDPGRGTHTQQAVRATASQAPGIHSNKPAYQCLCHEGGSESQPVLLSEVSRAAALRSRPLKSAPRTDNPDEVQLRHQVVTLDPTAAIAVLCVVQLPLCLPFCKGDSSKTTAWPGAFQVQVNQCRSGSLSIP